MDSSSPTGFHSTEESNVEESYGKDDVKLVLEKESSEDEDPSHSWWSEGRLTICFVHWVHTKFDGPREFCEVLRSVLPSGTHFHGCKRDVEGVENDYIVVLGFPCRIGSWKGLKDRLNPQDGDRPIDAEKVRVYFVDPAVEKVDSCFKFWLAVCVLESVVSERFSSSLSAFGLPPCFSSVEEMWTMLDQYLSDVE